MFVHGDDSLSGLPMGHVRTWGLWESVHCGKKTSIDCSLQLHYSQRCKLLKFSAFVVELLVAKPLGKHET